MKSQKLIAAATGALVIFFAAGCQELAAQRRYDRSIPISTPVEANGISARTPQNHLLLKKTADGFRLDDPDGFEVIAVRRQSRAAFDRLLLQDRKRAQVFDEVTTSHRGEPLPLYIACYGKNGVTQFTCFTHIGSGSDGLLVEYSRTYLQNLTEGSDWKDAAPSWWPGFLDSLAYRPAGTSTTETR